MFALVKYIEDGKLYVANVSDIKKFDEDFIITKKYKVKFSDGHYYKAYIVSLGETPEEAKKNAEGKRFRQPTTRYEDESETSTCDEQDVTQQKAKKMNLQKAAVTNFQNITSRMLDSNAIEKNKLKLEVSNLKEEIAALKKENAVLRNLNIDLQQVVIEKFKNLVTTESSIHRVEETNSNDQALPGARQNGNVHLGRGIWMQSQIFDCIYRKKKDTIFLKELATAVFGEEVLKNSSVCGSASNRNKNEVAKPALDPTKLLAMQDLLKHRLNERGVAQEEQAKVVKKFDYIINEKIQDLRRPPRNNKKKSAVR